MYDVPVYLTPSLSSSQCVDPYFREPGGTCTLDTDGDRIADYKDLCPYEFGENCPKLKPPPVLTCPRETDLTWKLFWRDTERGVTLYTRCPGGVNVSAGKHICLYCTNTLKHLQLWGTFPNTYIEKTSSTAVLCIL